MVTKKNLTKNKQDDKFRVYHDSQYINTLNQQIKGTIFKYEQFKLCFEHGIHNIIFSIKRRQKFHWISVIADWFYNIIITPFIITLWSGTINKKLYRQRNNIGYSSSNKPRYKSSYISQNNTYNMANCSISRKCFVRNNITDYSLKNFIRGKQKNCLLYRCFVFTKKETTFFLYSSFLISKKQFLLDLQTILKVSILDRSSKIHILKHFKNKLKVFLNSWFDIYNAKSAFYILDTSIVLNKNFLLFLKKFSINYKLIPGCVLSEIDLMSKSNDNITKKKGEMGQMNLYKMSYDKSIIFDDTKKTLMVGDKVDDLLLELYDKICISTQKIFLTSDNDLYNLARKKNILSLNINEELYSLNTNIKINDVISVQIHSVGEKQNQGLGNADDGSLIVVENAKPFINKTIEVIVVNIKMTISGKIFFCTLK